MQALMELFIPFKKMHKIQDILSLVLPKVSILIAFCPLFLIVTPAIVSNTIGV